MYCNAIRGIRYTVFPYTPVFTCKEVYRNAKKGNINGIFFYIVEIKNSLIYIIN